MKKLFINYWLILLLIIIAAFWVRQYRINIPLGDWHSWRQADTAAVTRNFIKEGLNPLLPKYDDMSGVAEKPIANPARFRFVEFPIYNIAVYPWYLLFGIDDRYSRLVSILFSLGSTALIFLITKKYINSITGLIAAFTFALLPFNIFFSRTTLPEPTFIFFALGMLYFVDKWIEKSASWRMGFIFAAIAFLIKPWAVFFFLPLLYSVWIKNNNKKFWIKFIIFTLLALLPFISWRLWMLQQPQGIPASSWLLNSDGIRFRPAFWWWIVSERMGREILGATGIILFFIGLITRPQKGYFLHFWAISSFLFMAVFATGNVRHNYYQTQFVPIASIFMSLGFLQLLKGGKLLIPRFWTIILAFFLYSLSFYFGYKIVKEFYNVNNPDMVEAGKAADKILPKDAIVVTPYNGDTAFLYQTNRAGWPVTALPLAELVTDYGTSAYISTARDAKTKWVMRHFQVLEETDKFVIADLTKLKLPLTTDDPEP